MLIPAGRFETVGLLPKQRIEAWQEACYGFYDMSVDKQVLTVSRAFFTWHRLDNLMFSSGVSHPHRATRGARHIRQQRPYVRLLFARRGGSWLVTEDQAVELRSRMVHLIDYARPFVHLRDHSIDLDGVYIPHDELGYDPARHPACLSIGMETPIGQVLAGAFFALQGRLSQVSTSEAPILAAGFRDLVRTLVLPEQKSDRGLAEMRSRRRAAMRAHIERNLREPSLDVDSLARAFCVSRPTVYRDFASAGGLARYVMTRRLERAFIDLVEHPPMRGAVRAVSENWGFESVSHFSRRFRERFRVAPGEVVADTKCSGLTGRTGDNDTGRHTVDCLVDRKLSDWFASSD